MTHYNEAGPATAATVDRPSEKFISCNSCLPLDAVPVKSTEVYTAAFLRAAFALLGDEALPEGCAIGICEKVASGLKRYACESIESAAAIVEKIGSRNCVYFETSLGPTQVAGGRLSANEAQLVANVRLDIDFASPFRGAGKAYPADEAEALSILAPVFELLRPSLVVRSGYGFQVYWCFKEPVDLTDLKERMLYLRAAALLFAYAKNLMAKVGFDLDNVSDLARIMRIPGGFNCKDPNNPIQVTFEDFDLRYASPEDLLDALPEIEIPFITNAADINDIDLRTYSTNEVQNAVIKKIKLLIDIEEKHEFADQPNSVKLAWDREHRPGDNSQSEFDWRFLFALCISGVEWSNEELAAALVVFRKFSAQIVEKTDAKAAAKIRKKAERSDYVKRTVANIRAATATTETIGTELNLNEEGTEEQVSLPLPKAGSYTVRAQQTKAMAEAYPLPKLYNLPLYIMKDGNNHSVYRAGKRKNSYTRVSSPFGVVARLCYIDEDGVYGLRIAVQGFDRQRHIIDIPRSELVQGNSKQLLQALLAHGLIPEPKQEEIVIQAIRGAAPENEILCVRRRGWFPLPDEDGTLAFAAPCGTIVTSEADIEVELENGSRLGLAAVSGSLEEAQTSIMTGLVAVQSKVPHLVLGVIIGLSGPILGLSGLPPCGVSYSGRTSTGKSTGQKMAAGCWGKPTPGHGLFQTFNATAGAAEALAEEGSGTCLILDELGLVDGEELGRLIYDISTGTGRNRLRPDASKSDARRWSCVMFFSGEIGIEQKVKQDRGKWAAGLTTRVIDIDVSATKTLSREEFAAVEVILQHHGHLGPEFVRCIIKANWHRCGNVLRKRIIERSEEIAGVNAKPALKRAAIPIAILEVTGELAQEFELLPKKLDVKAATRWAWASFLGSDEAVSLDPEQKVLDALHFFISTNWGSRILSVNETGINCKEVYGVHDGIECVYIFLPAFEKAIESAGVKPRDATRMLRKAGYITKTHDKNRDYVIGIPGWNRKDKAYALNFEVFGRRSGAVCDPQLSPVREEDE